MRDKPIHYFLAAGGCLVVAALCVTLHFQGQPAKSSSIKQPGQTTTANLAAPGNVEEVKPTAEQKAAHTVPADHPRYLKIEKLGINQVRVLSVGVDAKGQIGSPANVHDAAWFKTSAKPGQEGTMFIDGHLSGPNEPGVFANLKTLNKGDVVSVETGAGTTINYTVEQVEQVPVDKVDMETVLENKPGEQTLTLMTCGGRFDKEKDAYEDRVIVHATHQEQ